MRSAVVAMLMAGALAAPSAHRAHMRIHQEREEAVVVETAIAYTTVTAGGAAPTVAPAPAAPQAKVVTVAAPAAPAPAASSAAAPVPAAPSAYTPPAPIKPSAAAPPASSAAAPSSSPNTSGLSDFQKQALDAHNQHRANHSAPALTYDTGLEAAAMQLASNCNFADKTHDTTIDAGSLGQYGQNAACGSSITDVITGMWYNNEVMNYHWFGGEPPSDSSTFIATGHFTQVVWKGSTKVGCATAQCPNGVVNAPTSKSKTICNYSGAGNFGGQYSQNVLPALGHAPIVDKVNSYNT